MAPQESSGQWLQIKMIDKRFLQESEQLDLIASFSKYSGKKFQSALLPTTHGVSPTKEPSIPMKHAPKKLKTVKTVNKMTEIL